MRITDKMVQEMKDLYKKKSGEEIDDEKAYEAASNLIGFVELMVELGQEEARRKVRLKKEPNGFPVDANYSCRVCKQSINESNGWWDLLGPKCLLCQKAIKEGTVPSYICVNDNSWFSSWGLKYSFDIKSQTMKKYVREGKLIAREILNDQGKVHEYVFLKAENPGLIERYNPVRKSYDRHRKKETKRMIREEKAKLRRELGHTKR